MGAEWSYPALLHVSGGFGQVAPARWGARLSSGIGEGADERPDEQWDGAEPCVRRPPVR